MSVISLLASEAELGIVYPSADGKPIAETALPWIVIILLYEALQDFLPQADLIAADLYWYWEEGNPKARRAPDVMAVKGVGRAHRCSFLTWRESGAIPSTIFRIKSEESWREV